MGKRKFKLSTHRKNEEKKKQQIRVNQRSENVCHFILIIYAFFCFLHTKVESSDTNHP